MGFVDCDSHLIETEHTWDYLDPSEQIYRPRVAHFDSAMVSAGGIRPTAGNIAAPPGEMWVIADTWSTKLRNDSNMLGNANLYNPATTDLTDPAARKEDLDALGIDKQLLISTIFIGVELENPLVEAALCRSYNRWAAELASAHTDRFNWTLRAPLRDLDRAFKELEFGANHGAIGVHLRGIEHGYQLSDPYFYPLYERAQDLNLAMCVHVGSAHRRIINQPIGRLLPTPSAFMNHLYQIMSGFHAVVANDLHVRFPALRWGFLEAGATWIPGVLQQHARLIASGSNEFLHLRPITPDQIEEKNIFITCEADEDLPYLIKHAGENALCVGTDYAHNDVGSELAAHSNILGRSDITAEQARKLVDTNGRRFLGLPVAASGTSQFKRVPDPLPHVRGAVTPDAPVLVNTAG
jgi:uncharacterized protein